MAKKKSKKKVVKKKATKSPKVKEAKVDLSQVKLFPQCASNNVFYSNSREELICRDCGGIFSKLTPEQMKKLFK